MWIGLTWLTGSCGSWKARIRRLKIGSAPGSTKCLQASQGPLNWLDCSRSVSGGCFEFSAAGNIVHSNESFHVFCVFCFASVAMAS